MKPLPRSLLTEIYHAPFPAAELTHRVGLWNSNGTKSTNTVGGLCYVLSDPRADLTGRRLVADGTTYTGDGIARWAEANVPESLAIARSIRARFQPANTGTANTGTA